MKYLGFILAFYVLVCSAFPCCAMDGCNAGTKIESSSGTHQDNDCKGANCSPFFACGGCSGFSINVRAIDITPVLIPDKISHSGFYLLSSSEYFSFFWQPPKIS